MRFEHESLAQRVIFAPGAAASAVRAEVERLGARRIMLIAAWAEEDLAAAICRDLTVAVRFDRVVMHVPADIASEARAEADGHDVDLLLSVGGGSTTGLAKAVALTSGLPIVSVPTTYAGSEATSVWGMTEGARKTTGVDVRVLPRSVIYDASLTVSLPVGMSVASGLNALAHCIDSMWAPRTDPINQAFALEGVRALGEGLPALVADPEGMPGRERALLGAYLAARAFSSAGSGLHHKICHVLGGMFNLPHAQTHAVALPHVLALNAPFVPTAMARVAEAFGAGEALAGLNDLRRVLHAPRALRDYATGEVSLDEAVEPILAAAPADNPAPLTGGVVADLLHRMWEGADIS